VRPGPPVSMTSSVGVSVAGRGSGHTRPGACRAPRFQAGRPSLAARSIPGVGGHPRAPAVTTSSMPILPPGRFTTPIPSSQLSQTQLTSTTVAAAGGTSSSIVFQYVAKKSLPVSVIDNQQRVDTNITGHSAVQKPGLSQVLPGPGGDQLKHTGQQPFHAQYGTQVSFAGQAQANVRSVPANNIAGQTGKLENTIVVQGTYVTSSGVPVRTVTSTVASGQTVQPGASSGMTAHHGPFKGTPGPQKQMQASSFTPAAQSQTSRLVPGPSSDVPVQS
jgi:hypothetical protein